MTKNPRSLSFYIIIDLFRSTLKLQINAKTL
jgi:hypothetical protein